LYARRIFENVCCTISYPMVMCSGLWT
jgi:hypothetical protein